MFMPLQSFSFSRQPGQLKMVAELPYYIYKGDTITYGAYAMQEAKMTFVPCSGAKILYYGLLTLLAGPRIATDGGSHLHMKADVLSPSHFTLGPVRLDHVVIVPERGRAGLGLGPVVLDHIQGYIDEAGPLHGKGLIKLDALITDHQSSGPRFIPVTVITYNPAHPPRVDHGIDGWNLSTGKFSWETPHAIGAPVVEVEDVVTRLTIGITVNLPAIGVGDAADHSDAPEPEANHARSAGKAAAQAHHHQARRPAAKAAKRK